MRRLVFGAAALVTGLLAGLGVAIGVRRRRSHRDEVLPLDPAPPLGVAAPGSSSDEPEPSVEADFGPEETGGDATPAKPRRRRQRRKPAVAADAASLASEAEAALAPSDGSGAPTAPAKPRRRTPAAATDAAADATDAS